MKCFRHPGIDALGMCKACFKGLCAMCAVDVGNGIACKNSCESTVKALNTLVSEAKGVTASNAVMYFFTGCLAAVAGFYVMGESTIMGFALILLGFILFALSGRFFIKTVETRRQMSKLNELGVTSNSPPEQEKPDMLLENEFEKLESEFSKSQMPTDDTK